MNNRKQNIYAPAVEHSPEYEEESKIHEPDIGVLVGSGNYTAVLFMALPAMVTMMFFYLNEHLNPLNMFHADTFEI